VVIRVTAGIKQISSTHALTWLCSQQLLQLPVQHISLARFALDLITAPLQLNLVLGNGSILQGVVGSNNKALWHASATNQAAANSHVLPHAHAILGLLTVGSCI
jgi:hypothetical protein